MSDRQKTLFSWQGQKDLNPRHAVLETADRAERKRHYVTTGWRELNGKWVYLSPGDPEHTVELENRLQGYGLCRKDDKSFLRLVPELLDTVAPSNVMYPLVAYAFSSVLNRFLKQAGCEPKTILMLLGKTGSKKSTLAALVLSFFGSFSLTTLPMSFRDTLSRTRKRSKPPEGAVALIQLEAVVDGQFLVI